MNKLIVNKRTKRILRHRRVRSVVSGTSNRPRLAVFRSLKSTYVQLIDDVVGKTLAQARSLELKGVGNKTQQAKELGRLLAERAKKLGVSEAVFDRGGYKYHGRVQAVADAAREAGLKF